MGGEGGDDGVFGRGTGVEGLEDGEGGLVEVEDGGRGDQVEEGLAPGFEGVEFALGEEGGVRDRGVRGLRPAWYARLRSSMGPVWWGRQATQ